jgi:alkylation response protein AidB-like acyl-CoA dehydrogenase
MQETLDAARAIAPRLEAVSETSELARRVDDDAVAALQEAGLIRLMAPRAHGGAELPIRHQILSCAETAKACPAASWLQMVCGAHTYIAGRYPETCQAEVFATGPDVLIPGTLAPQGAARQVEGGWRVSGRWQFGSGCDHGPWFLIGAATPEGPPGGVHVIVPAAEVTIDDTWYTLGLRGTGSKDLVLEDVFVPDHRAMLTPGLFVGQTAEDAGALYHLPVAPGLASMLAGSVLGMAERGYRRFVDYAAVRKEVIGTANKAEKAGTQMRVAQSGIELQAARLLLEGICDRFDAVMAADEPPMPLAERVQVRWEAAYVVELCRRATERLFAAAGAHGIYDTSPLQRVFRDINTASHHAIVDFDNLAEAKGMMELGLEVSPRLG